MTTCSFCRVEIGMSRRTICSVCELLCALRREFDKEANRILKDCSTRNTNESLKRFNDLKRIYKVRGLYNLYFTEFKKKEALAMFLSGAFHESTCLYKRLLKSRYVSERDKEWIRLSIGENYVAAANYKQAAAAFYRCLYLGSASSDTRLEALVRLLDLSNEGKVAFVSTKKVFVLFGELSRDLSGKAIRVTNHPQLVSAVHSLRESISPIPRNCPH